MAKELKIEGMKCEGCKRAVIAALNKVDGVNLVQVDLPSGKAMIETSKPVDDSALIQAVEQAGYKVVD